MVARVTTTETMRYLLGVRSNLPLSLKIPYTLRRIKIWYEYWGGRVYVAFSGGKDSTVLLDLVWSVYPDVPAVFADTGNEFDSVKEFVAGYDERVVTVEPIMTFEEIVKKHGYPFPSKRVARYVSDLQRPFGVNEATKNLRLTGYTRAGNYAPSMKLAKKWRYLVDDPYKITNKCCGILKINPTKPYAKATGRMAFVGTMATESNDRLKSYLKHGGCNAFDQKHAHSRPMMFWREEDVLQYILDRGLPIADIYGDIVTGADGTLTTTGEKRTGCKNCMFGIEMEKEPNRIQRLARIEPESYRHYIEDLKYGEFLEHHGVPWRPVEEAMKKDEIGG